MATGGGKGPGLTIFRSRIELPNFLRFVPRCGETFERRTGIHGATVAAGKRNEYFLGSPVSLGCLRVSDYAAKFMPWYLPRGSKLFVHYDEALYKAHP